MAASVRLRSPAAAAAVYAFNVGVCGIPRSISTGQLTPAAVAAATAAAAFESWTAVVTRGVV